MNLADERLKELDDPSLTEDERILRRCRLSAEFVQVWQHEAARRALGPLWRGVGVRPDVEGLAEEVAAEVLLQVGALSSCMDARRQVAGTQEAAKDLISESAALFERLNEGAKAALARSDLALCYWREGTYDDARIILEEAATRAGEDAEIRLTIVLRLVIVESCVGRHTDVLRLLKESAPLLEKTENHTLKAVFHNELAIVLRKLGTAERRGDYFDLTSSPKRGAEIMRVLP